MDFEFDLIIKKNDLCKLNFIEKTCAFGGDIAHKDPPEFYSDLIECFVNSDVFDYYERLTGMSFDDSYMGLYLKSDELRDLILSYYLNPKNIYENGLFKLLLRCVSIKDITIILCREDENIKKKIIVHNAEQLVDAVFDALFSDNPKDIVICTA